MTTSRAVLFYISLLTVTSAWAGEATKSSKSIKVSALTILSPGYINVNGGKLWIADRLNNYKTVNDLGSPDELSIRIQGESEIFISNTTNGKSLYLGSYPFQRDEWLWMKAVTLEGVQQGIQFAGYPEFSIKGWGSLDVFNVVDGWAKGKTIYLAYSPDKGVFALNKDDGTKVELLIYNSKKHPISAICMDGLGKHSTMGMMSKLADASLLWRIEIQRILQQLRGDTTTPTEKETLEQSQERWVAYFEAEKARLYSINNRDNSSNVTLSDLELQITISSMLSTRAKQLMN